MVILLVNVKFLSETDYLYSSIRCSVSDYPCGVAGRKSCWLIFFKSFRCIIVAWNAIQEVNMVTSPHPYLHQIILGNVEFMGQEVSYEHFVAVEFPLWQCCRNVIVNSFSIKFSIVLGGLMFFTEWNFYFSPIDFYTNYMYKTVYTVNEAVRVSCVLIQSVEMQYIAMACHCFIIVMQTKNLSVKKAFMDWNIS